MSERIVADVTWYLDGLGRLFADAVAEGDYARAEVMLTFAFGAARDRVEVEGAP